MLAARGQPQCFGSLRGKAHLIDQVADVVHRVVTGRIQFKDVKAEILVSRCFTVFGIDHFGQDAGAGGFTHPPWSGEEQGLGQVILANGIEQGVRHVLLTNYLIKGLGAIFPCRDDEIFHRGKYREAAERGEADVDNLRKREGQCRKLA